MERRVHAAFGRRLFALILASFVAAMASLGLGMMGARERLPTVRAIGYCGFLACGAVVFIPLLAWWPSRGCSCPGCGQGLILLANSDQDVGGSGIPVPGVPILARLRPIDGPRELASSIR
jgi:hypothetical protein